MGRSGSRSRDRLFNRTNGVKACQATHGTVTTVQSAVELSRDLTAAVDGNDRATLQRTIDNYHASGEANPIVFARLLGLIPRVQIQRKIPLSNGRPVVPLFQSGVNDLEQDSVWRFEHG